MTVSWWKRNVIALVAILVCIPALIWMTLGVVLTDRAGLSPTVVEVAAGESVVVGGYSWRLTMSDALNGTDLDSPEMPAGAELIGAVMSIDPIAGEALTEDSCTIELTAASTPPPSSAARRVWRTYSSPYDFNYDLREGSTSFCSPDGESIQLESVFLVPAGIYDDATLDMTLSGARTIYRFALASR
ncbi:MAG: hypothetical protein ACOH1T_06030 [Microbacteriaceae bacterium]